MTLMQALKEMERKSIRELVFNYVKESVYFEKDVILLAPRRTGKTTLVTNIIKDHIGYGVNNILLVAPNKGHYENVKNILVDRLGLDKKKIQNKLSFVSNHTRSESYRCLNPDLLIVEEAAFVKNSLLKSVTSEFSCTKLMVSTPREVVYKQEETGKFESDCYLKDIWDYSPTCRKFSLGLNDSSHFEQIIEDRKFYTDKQFTTEFLAQWTYKFK